MKNIIILSVLLMATACGSTKIKVKKTSHSDSGFRYMAYMDSHRQLFEKQIAEMDEGSGLDTKEKTIIDPKNISKVKESAIGVGIEKNIFLSDCYTRDSIVEIVQKTPRFFGGSNEKIFLKWFLENSNIRINPALILSRECRGHLLLQVGFDDTGWIESIDVLSIDDEFYDGEISNAFINTLYTCPQTKPAFHKGKNVEFHYLIAITWGHYRTYNPLFDISDRDKVLLKSIPKVKTVNRLKKDENYEYDPFRDFK